MAYYFTEKQLYNIEYKMENWRKDIPVNRLSILSFIEGVETLMVVDDDNEDVTCNTISALMKNYLSNEYEITHPILDHAIFCFAFRKNIEWEEAFFVIFDEFKKHITWKNNYAYLNMKLTLDIDYFRCYNSIEEISKWLKYPVVQKESINLGEIDCSNGVKLSIGSEIQLGDKLQSFKNKTFNKSLKDKRLTWEDFKPSNYNFKTVRFFSQDITFANVSVHFSLVKSKIVEIKKVENTIYLITEYFEIDIEAALENEEVILVEFFDNENKNWQIPNLKEFEEKVESYLNGWLTADETFHSLTRYNSTVCNSNDKYQPPKYNGFFLHGDSMKRKKN